MDEISKWPPLPEAEWVERKGVLREPADIRLERWHYSDLFTLDQLRSYGSDCRKLALLNTISALDEFERNLINAGATTESNIAGACVKIIGELE